MQTLPDGCCRVAVSDREAQRERQTEAKMAIAESSVVLVVGRLQFVVVVA